MTPLTRATCKGGSELQSLSIYAGHHLLHREAQGSHVDDQVGVENHQAAALEEEYQLDPQQVSFTQIIPKPAESKGSEV